MKSNDAILLLTNALRASLFLLTVPSCHPTCPRTVPGSTGSHRLANTSSLHRGTAGKWAEAQSGLGDTELALQVQEGTLTCWLRGQQRPSA